MKVRSTMQFLVMVLVLGATALVFEPVLPVGGHDSQAGTRAPAPPLITFSSSPHWVTIPGTRVVRLSDSERPDYDVFRYGSRYYLYNDGSWYRSRQPNQRFVVISERNVPLAFSAVPSDHWRSYPPGWRNPKNPHYSGRHDNRKRSAHSGNSKRR